MKSIKIFLGARIRQLRQEKGITLEKLAYESGLTSKGYLSDIESGKKAPSLRVLEMIADNLEVELVDLFTFPEHSLRHELIDAIRSSSPKNLQELSKILGLK